MIRENVELQFKDGLEMILDQYSEGSPDWRKEPLCKDEVETLTSHLRGQLNLMNGNITLEEYLTLSENIINPTEALSINFRGKEVLFTNLRIEGELPKGLYQYQIRHDDMDFQKPATLENTVKVNYYGTLLSRELIALGEEGYLELTEEESNHLKTSAAGYTAVVNYINKREEE